MQTEMWQVVVVAAVGAGLAWGWLAARARAIDLAAAVTTVQRQLREAEVARNVAVRATDEARMEAEALRVQHETARVRANDLRGALAAMEAERDEAREALAQLAAAASVENTDPAHVARRVCTYIEILTRGGEAALADADRLRGVAEVARRERDLAEDDRRKILTALDAAGMPHALGADGVQALAALVERLRGALIEAHAILDATGICAQGTIRERIRSLAHLLTPTPLGDASPAPGEQPRWVVLRYLRDDGVSRALFTVGALARAEQEAERRLDEAGALRVGAVVMGKAVGA